MEWRSGIAGTVALLAVLGLGCVTPVSAAPCAGFVDVEDTDAFCPNVEWIRNRAITLGCSAGMYCPNDTVTRLQMAAFMNRLGNAVTPATVQASHSPGPLAIASPAVTCVTPDLNSVSYPRRIEVDAVFAAVSVTALTIGATIVLSDDFGTTWTPIAPLVSQTDLPANLWVNLSDTGYVDVEAGKNLRVGLRVSRIGGGTSLAESRCRVRAVAHSRSGSTTPY